MKNKKVSLITLPLLGVLATTIVLGAGVLWSYSKDNYGDLGYGDKSRSGRDGGRWDKRAGGGDYGFFNPEAMDENQDGEIARAEAETWLSKIFNDQDQNQDQQISLEEFKAFNQNRAEKFAELSYHKLGDKRIQKINDRSEKTFGRLDDDGNDQISLEEFSQKRIARIFDRIDKNQDGILQGKEMRRRK